MISVRRVTLTSALIVFAMAAFTPSMALVKVSEPDQIRRAGAELSSVAIAQISAMLTGTPRPVALPTTIKPVPGVPPVKPRTRNPHSFKQAVVNCLVFDTVDGAPFQPGMSANRFDGQGVSVTGHTNCGSLYNGFGGTITGGTGGNINCSIQGGSYYAFGCPVPPAPTGTCLSESLTITGTDANGHPMFSDPLPISMCTPTTERPCRCGSQQDSAGRPVDLVTGALWYRKVDTQMSGPLALRLSRYYDSSLNDTQNAFHSEMGTNWRSNYDGYIQGNAQGQYAVYHDSEGHSEMFFPLPLGGTARDNFSGDTLYLPLDDSEYQLITWKGDTLTFSPQGWLSSIKDRFGNTQSITRDGFGYVQSVQDSVGRQLVFTHDSGSGLITKVTSLPTGIVASFGYSGTNCPTGNLCSATEPDGKTWSYQYDGSNQLTKVLDGNGNIEEQNTFTNGQVTLQTVGASQNSMGFSYAFRETDVTDGNGNLTQYNWDGSGQITNVNGALCHCGGGTHASYHYDAYERIVEISSGAQDTQFVYGRDVTNNGVVTAYPGPTQILTPLNDTSGQRTVTLTYFDPTGSQRDLVQTMSEPSVDTPGKSRVVTYAYDTFGRIQSKTIVGYVAGVKTTAKTTYTVNTRGQVTQIVGPRTGVTTKYVYCPDAATFAANQLEKFVDAAGHTTVFSPSACASSQFDPYGHPKSIKDPNGVTSNFVFDGAGRILSKTIVNPTGPSPVTTYGYDGDGEVSSVTLPLHNAIEYGYDTSERLSSITLADSSLLQRDQLSYAYDSMSNQRLKSAASCTTPMTVCPTASWSVTQTESYFYDSLGNMFEATEPIPTGTYERFVYDGNGLLNVFYNGDTYATYQHAFGAQGLTSDNSETSVQYLHDTQGNTTSESVSKLSSYEPTTYKHDDFGRVTSMTSEETGTRTFQHDLAGNDVTEVQASGTTAQITTTRTYDSLNRMLTAVSTKSGAPTETVTLTYDSAVSGAFGLGRLASVTNSLSGVSYAYTYEYRGMLATQTQTVGATVYNLAYTYDANGNTISEAYPSGQSINYGYDFADRPLSASTTTTTFAASATYAPFGPLTSIAFGNGTTECKTYDVRYRPTENMLVTGSTTPCQTPATTLADYKYGEDAAQNITSIHDNLDPTYNRDFTYTNVNRLGNPTSGSSLWGNTGHNDYQGGGDLDLLQLGPAINLNFYYDTTNTTSWLTSVLDFVSGVTYTVSHDALGNQTQIASTNGTFNYVYSARNLLTSGDGVSYTYDGLRRRVASLGSSGTRWSFYDPANHLIAESRLNQTGQSGIGFNYVWFAGRPIAQVDDGGTHWTFTDHLGTPLIQTDGSKTISWRAEYEPSGLILMMRGQNYHQPLRLPGMEAEQLSGDTTNSANPNGDTSRFFGTSRWYQPQWGRYTQPDPLGLAAGINLYRYADNNPIGESDPSGLSSTADIGSQYIVDGVYNATGGLFANLADDTNSWIAAFDNGVTHGYVGQWCSPATTVSAVDLENFAEFAITTPFIAVDPELLAESGGAESVLGGIGGDAAAVENAPLANVLEGQSAGQGFTGVYDSSTGGLLIAPSTADADVPAGWVSRTGGHADVSAALGGSAANQSGFAVILQHDGTLNVTWRSGMLNPAPGYVVPTNLRPTIIDALQAATGRIVNP